MNKKLFIAGGSGFIGSAIAQTAHTMGYQVISISRSGRPELKQAWVDDVHWISTTVFETEQWEQHLQGCDALINCIGLVLERASEGMTFKQANIDSNITLAQAAQAANINKFVYVSADRKPSFIPEAYITTKRAAEEVLAQYPFQLAILRPGLVYGPKRLWSYLLYIAITLRNITTGQKAPPLHVDTVAKATVKAAINPQIEGIIDISAIKKLAK